MSDPLQNYHDDIKESRLEIEKEEEKIDLLIQYIKQCEDSDKITQAAKKITKIDEKLQYLVQRLGTRRENLRIASINRDIQKFCGLGI